RRAPDRQGETDDEGASSPEDSVSARAHIVAINKIDLPDARRRLPAIGRPFRARGIELHAISAAIGEGVPELLEEIWRRLGEAKAGAKSGTEARVEPATATRGR